MKQITTNQINHTQHDEYTIAIDEIECKIIVYTKRLLGNILIVYSIS